MKKITRGGRTFEVSEPKDCSMTVTGYGKSVSIRIEESEKGIRFVPNFEGRDGFAARSLQETVDMAVHLISESLDKTTKDALCQEMDEFYRNLP